MALGQRIKQTDLGLQSACGGGGFVEGQIDPYAKQNEIQAPYPWTLTEVRHEGGEGVIRDLGLGVGGRREQSALPRAGHAYLQKLTPNKFGLFACAYGETVCPGGYPTLHMHVRENRTELVTKHLRTE